MAIPQLSLFIPLVGSIGSGALAFVFPPIIVLLTFSSNLVKRGYMIAGLVAVSLILITCFGLVGSVFGVYSSVKQIVAFYSEGMGPPSTVTPSVVTFNYTV